MAYDDEGEEEEEEPNPTRKRKVSTTQPNTIRGPGPPNVDINECEMLIWGQGSRSHMVVLLVHFCNCLYLLGPTVKCGIFIYSMKFSFFAKVVHNMKALSKIR